MTIIAHLSVGDISASLEIDTDGELSLNAYDANPQLEEIKRAKEAFELLLKTVTLAANPAKPNQPANNQ